MIRRGASWPVRCAKDAGCATFDQTADHHGSRANEGSATHTRSIARVALDA